MRLQLRKPAQSLDKTYARQPIPQEQMDLFRRALAQLIAQVDEKESEEYQQKIVADFLRESVHSSAYRISAGAGVDLIVQAEPGSPETTDKVVSTTIIETRKVFAGEMMTPLKNNVRALHELILYYFENAERESPNVVCHLIITDVYNWFFFDERDFRRFFYHNLRLKKLFQIRQQQKKGDAYFFTETARILRDLDAEVPVTYLNLRETADVLTLSSDQGNRLLAPVVKLFSPAHLIKQPFDSGTNAFNQQFYEELLHSIGIYEQPVGKQNSRTQRLPESERSEGSLLENTITQIRKRDVLASLGEVDTYGATKEEQLVAIGLELCLTWLTRLLFLKVNEKQLFQLGLPVIHSFADLDELFVDVIAVSEQQRSEELRSRFVGVPYLNCPLFTETDLERKTITIRDLDDTLELSRFAQTAVANDEDSPLTTLPYLLTFLSDYDFSGRLLPVVQETDKPQISSAMLGLIFEKISNQHNGLLISGRIVTHMVRNAVRQATCSAFSALPELASESGKTINISALKSYFGQLHKPDALLHVNAIFNSLRIVDPAVGSGRFLVSALNELIALKAELGLLVDRDGQRIHQLDVSVVDDELLIINTIGELFEYTREDDITMSFSPFERERIQATLFHEKQILLENCLFGVDRQEVAVNFCQFRLWTELLKSTYSSVETGRYAALSPVRHTDPSLQVTTNLKTGDSLVSRFDLGFQDDDLKTPIREKFLSEVKWYKVSTLAYKQSREAAEKNQIYAHIQEIESTLNPLVLVDQKETVAIRRLEAKLAQSALPFDVVSQEVRLQKLVTQLASQKKALADKQRLFQQSVEWRYAFPEVLDDTGNYAGFDIVLGYPPVSHAEGFVSVRPYFQRAFPNSYVSKVDTYALFVELGVKLLKPGGELVYWLPKKWLKAGNTGKLRAWLKTWTALLIDETSLLSTDEIADMSRILLIQKVPNANTTATQP